MALNTDAKMFYDKAVQLADEADGCDDVNSTMAHTAVGNLYLELAKFAVSNHALVRGIDEGMPPVRTTPSANIATPPDGPHFWR